MYTQSYYTYTLLLMPVHPVLPDAVQPTKDQGLIFENIVFEPFGEKNEENLVI